MNARKRWNNKKEKTDTNERTNEIFFSNNYYAHSRWSHTTSVMVTKLRHIANIYGSDSKETWKSNINNYNNNHHNSNNHHDIQSHAGAANKHLNKTFWIEIRRIFSSFFAFYYHRPFGCLVHSLPSQYSIKTQHKHYANGSFPIKKGNQIDTEEGEREREKTRWLQTPS